MLFLFVLFLPVTSIGHGSINDESSFALNESKRLAGISPKEALTFAEKALAKSESIGNDSLTVEILLHMGSLVSTKGDKKEALMFFEKALELSEKNLFRQGICKALLEVGYIHYGWGEYDLSLSFFEKALKLAVNHKMKDEEAKALNLLGKYYHTKGNFAVSVDYYKKAISATNELVTKDQSVNFYLNLGKTYISDGNIYMALSYYLKAYDVSLSIDDKLLKADVLNHLGSIYLLLKQPEKSLDYHRKALQLRREVNDPQALATSFNNIGETFLDSEHFDSAYFNFEQSHQLCLKTDYRKGIIKTLTNMGRVENRTEKFDKARQHLTEAYSLSTSSGYDAGIVESALALGENLLAQKLFVEAKEYFEISLSKMEKANIFGFKPDALQGMYECFKQQDDFEKALQYHEKYTESKLKAILSEGDRQLAELRVSFDLERNENDNQLLRQENELKQLALKQRAWVIWSIVVALVFTILLCLLIYNRYIQKRKSHTELQKLVSELEQANVEKDRMFSIITHELRNPLFWFQNLTEMLSKNHSKMGEEKLQKSFAAIDESAKNAFHLMDNLLNWSRARLNRINPRKANYQLKLLVDETLRMYTTIIGQKEISLRLSIPSEAVAHTDADMFACILRNLLSNAIKFTPTGGTISIESQHENDFYEISVSDTGVGITAEQFLKLTSNSLIDPRLGLMQEKGSGLGLKLCREFVHLNGGKIRMTNKEGVGSCFVFTVPSAI